MPKESYLKYDDMYWASKVSSDFREKFQMRTLLVAIIPILLVNLRMLTSMTIQ